jgi:hypothetical protein
MSRRINEENAHRHDPDIEIVLLTASSHEALIQTHARYFKSIPELGAALGAARRSLPEPEKTRLSKGKSGRTKRKK